MFLVEVLPRRVQAGCSATGQRSFPRRLPILAAFFAGSVLAGFRRRRRVLEIERDQPRRAEPLAGGQRGRDLKHPLGADEVGLKRRTQRIATPAHTGGLGAALGQQRIIERHHQRLVRLQLGQDAAAHGAEQGLAIHPRL